MSGCHLADLVKRPKRELDMRIERGDSKTTHIVQENFDVVMGLLTRARCEFVVGKSLLVDEEERVS